MTSSHKISLHLSKNSSLDSLRESQDLKPQEAQKPADNVLRTKESLNKIKQILSNTSEKFRPQNKNLPSSKPSPKPDSKKGPKKAKKDLLQSQSHEKLMEACRKLYSSEKDLRQVESTLDTFVNYTDLINSSNLSEALLRSLSLCHSLLTSSPVRKDPEFHLNQIVEEDISQLLRETSALSSKINRQKQRILEIHQKLENSAEKSKIFIESFDNISLSISHTE